MGQEDSGSLCKGNGMNRLGQEGDEKERVEFKDDDNDKEVAVEAV